MVDAGYDIAPAGREVPFTPAEDIPTKGNPSTFQQARLLQEQARRRRN
jgi:hypothetical protein